MHVGDKVKLTGITQHGKNRVREQSDVWEVIRMIPQFHLKHLPLVPFMLLQATKGIQYALGLHRQRRQLFSRGY